MIFDLISRYKYQLILVFVCSWLIFLGICKPLNSNYYPKCPVKYSTGLECPGCGSSRCAKEMVSLEFEKAFNYNPLAFIAIPAILIFSLFKVFGIKLKYRFPFIERYGAILIFVIVCVFTFLRNLN